MLNLEPGSINRPTTKSVQRRILMKPAVAEEPVREAIKKTSGSYKKIPKLRTLSKQGEGGLEVGGLMSEPPKSVLG